MGSKQGLLKDFSLQSHSCKAPWDRTIGTYAVDGALKSD